jgi:uncharacterized membrane protein
LGGIRRALAACDHRHRLDRVELLLHRARSGAAATSLSPGADGEEWQVHGGGFYHIQKYMVAPEAMPEHLTWFKWESYATWLSGVALLILLYWVGAELYLIDWTVMELAPWQAIAISALSLTLGWVAYDRLCKSKLGDNPTP